MSIIARPAGSNTAYDRFVREKAARARAMRERLRNPNIPRGTETWGDWGQSKERTQQARDRWRRRQQQRTRGGSGVPFRGSGGMGRPSTGLAGGRGGQGRGGFGQGGGMGMGIRPGDDFGQWNKPSPNARPVPMGMGGGVSGGFGDAYNRRRGQGRVIDKYSRWGGPNQRPDGKQTLPNFRPVEQGRRWDAGSSGGRGQTTGAWAGDRHRGGKYGGEWDWRKGGGASDWQGRFKVGNWRGPTVTPGEVPGGRGGMGMRGGSGGSFMAGGQNARKGLDEASSRRRAQRRRNQAGPQRGPVKTSDGRGRRMSNTWDLKNRRGARGRRNTGRIVPRRGGGFISTYGGGGANRGRVIPGRRRVIS